MQLTDGFDLIDPAPGMFWITIDGLPGMYLGR